MLKERIFPDPLIQPIAILNDFLCISVLMNFGEIKFMFLAEKVKQKFDNLKRHIAFLRKMRYDVTDLNEVKNIEPQNVLQL
jgi:hypothetical protein